MVRMSQDVIFGADLTCVGSVQIKMSEVLYMNLHHCDLGPVLCLGSRLKLH